jgi:Zn-finger nucleic acid-binding protein
VNCPNCGAPMNIVGDRGYFFCSYCGDFLFPNATADGVKVLGEDSSAPCPVCNRSLVSAVVADHAPVLYCRNCRGLLVAQSNFLHVVRELRAQAEGPEGRFHRITEDERRRSIFCPACSRQMDTHPYYGPGNVLIDICTQCQLVWLDYGELSIIINAPGRDRGQREFYA